MANPHITSNVPPDRVGFIVALAKATGGRLVDKIPEDDGEFTLIFEFPEAPVPTPETAPTARPTKHTAGAGPVNPAGGTTTGISAVAPGGAPWLEIARAAMGVVEAPGVADDSRVVAFHASTNGGPAPDSVPWCSSFVNWCITRAGLAGTGSKSARSWLGWGVDSVGPIPGCIVVLERGSPPNGHVGFLVGVEPGRVLLLGGNQGDRVGIASFLDERVLGMRVPSPAALAAAGLAGEVTLSPALRQRRIDTLARTIWGEARGESERGMEAVAAVVVNRARRGPASRFGEGIDGVCRQPQQFSCWNDDDPNLPKLRAVTTTDDAFKRCISVAERAVDGKLDDPTFGSDHYHSSNVAPDWAAGHKPAVSIGPHLFFNSIA